MILELRAPELEKAEAADPKLPFVHLYLGIAYLRLSKNEEALAEFAKGVRGRAGCGLLL